MSGITCWFCKKGRHKECIDIMVDSGDHDCSFGSKVVKCSCLH